LSRLGPLRERDYRLLFVARTTSRLGGSMAPVALAFAVLTTLHGSASDLGLVLTARMIPTVCFLLLGGVLGDRLPRHVVMVGSNLVSAGSQAAAAALLLSGHATVANLAALAAVNGLSSAFFMPASEGVVPLTVAVPLLQQANTLLRLSTNATTILGASLAGVLVAATSPGWAIAVDAVTFLVAAAATARMRLPRQNVHQRSMLHELREGWTDFWSRTWLWAIVLQFGIVNAAEGGTVNVLGPKVANEHLGGATTWGAFLAATSIGLLACGVVLLRWRPRRILLLATLASFGLALPPLALAPPVPVALLLAVGFVYGWFFETFGVMWTLAMQEQIPREKLSRMFSYDMLGSFVLLPVGMALVGPIDAAIGDRATLLGCAALVVVATAPVLLSRDVRTLERTYSR
jgi:MFS family permease